jgi:type II secretory pathway predicted ATPase ExeA
LSNLECDYPLPPHKCVLAERPHKVLTFGMCRCTAAGVKSRVRILMNNFCTLLRRTLSLREMHEALRQRIRVQYHLEGLTRQQLDAYLAQQLKARSVSPLFDDTARQGMYQAAKGIPRKVIKLGMTILRQDAASKSQMVSQAILLDAAAEATL